jgi:hypothetical protein
MNITGNGNFVFQNVNNSNVNIGSKETLQQFLDRTLGVGNLGEFFPKCFEYINNNTLTLLSGRFHSNLRDFDEGLIQIADFKMEENKIRAALTNIFNYSPSIPQFQQVTQTQPEITMNRYSNLSKSDCAVVLSKYFTDINPTNRPSVAKLVSEIKNCQEILNYSKLQEVLGEFAALLVNPAVDNHKDIVFKQTYDALVAKTIATLAVYLKVIDSVLLKNESGLDALTRLNSKKTLANLKLWKDALCREAGTNFPKIQEIESSYNTWVEYLTGFDAVEQEIMIDFQVIDDLKRVSK